MSAVQQSDSVLAWGVVGPHTRLDQQDTALPQGSSRMTVVGAIFKFKDSRGSQGGQGGVSETLSGTVRDLRLDG